MPKRLPVAAGQRLFVRLLGTMAVYRDGTELVLPASRKARALIAYLALATHGSSRTRLCELLGDAVPDDPRGELRWCLSKARSVVDDPGRKRVVTAHDNVRLDLDDGFVDVLEVERATRAGIDSLDAAQLRACASLFAGDFLDRLEIERSAAWTGWLMAERRRLRGVHLAVLEHLVARLADDSEEGFVYLEKWLQLAPFDRRAHELMLKSLLRLGRIHEAEAQFARSAQLFESEGLDFLPVRRAWQEARRHANTRSAPGDSRPTEAPHGAMPRSAVPRSETAVAMLQPELQLPAAGVSAAAQRRASIAVMPLADSAAHHADRGGLANSLVHDIITRLAKLRSLFVIAQGTVFALDGRGIGSQAVGRTLDVDYVAGGSLRREGKRIAVNIELVETRTARVVWAESFDRTLDDTFLVLDEIGNRIVASIAGEIEAIERERAVLKAPSSLDAWEAHHRGLWHMYRFNRADNDRARQCFELAVRLDPGFSRAHAGLSFTHWQDAFQHWRDGHAKESVDHALAAAERSLVADDRDPAAHWAMGRALWLRGRQEPALEELRAAVELSPNFALGHYALAFIHSQSGDPAAAIESADQSRHLSPYDPLLFGMLASRAMALVRLGRSDEAADWALKAAARPNAHAHILGIAAHCLALAGRLDEARGVAASIHRSLPGYRVGDFLAAFKFAPDAEALYRSGAARIGMA